VNIGDHRRRFAATTLYANFCFGASLVLAFGRRLKERLVL
jgi:hypothetical protein